MILMHLLALMGNNGIGRLGLPGARCARHPQRPHFVDYIGGLIDEFAKVLAGLFKIIETLFDVSIRPDSAPVWKPGVAAPTA